MFFTFYTGQDKFEDIGSNGIQWGNFAGSLRWNHIPNDKMFINTSLYSSNYNYYLFTNPGTSDAWHSSISNLSLKSDFTYFAKPENTVYFGLGIRFHHFNPGNFESNVASRASNVAGVPQRNTNEFVLYAGNEQMFMEKLSIKYGLRLSIWQNIGPTTEFEFDDDYNPVDFETFNNGNIYNSYTMLAPRLGLTYKFADRLSAKVYYSRTVQNIHLITNSICARRVLLQ